MYIVILERSCNMESTEQRKLLSALCHGAIFFSSTLVAVAIPIVILFTTEDSVVKANARESLNFHINLYIYAFIVIALCFVFIGFLLIPVLGIINIAMPILALVKVMQSPDEPYRYPFIFRIV